VRMRLAMLGSPRLYSSNLCKGLLMQGRIVLQVPLHKEAEHRDEKAVGKLSVRI